VDVYERTTEPLTGRGAGIVTHVRQRHTLARCGVALDASIGCEVVGRVALARSGDVVGRKPLRQTLSAWGRFYDALLAASPGSAITAARRSSRSRNAASGCKRASPTGPAPKPICW
jgi:hypothetical protein